MSGTDGKMGDVLVDAAEIARLHAVEKIALRFVRAWQAEGQAKIAWAAGAHDELVDGTMEDFQGPLTDAYDDAQDERVVAFKLLAKAVT